MELVITNARSGTTQRRHDDDETRGKGDFCSAQLSSATTRQLQQLFCSTLCERMLTALLAQRPRGESGKGKESALVLLQLDSLPALVRALGFLCDWMRPRTSAGRRGKKSGWVSFLRCCTLHSWKRAQESEQRRRQNELWTRRDRARGGLARTLAMSCVAAVAPLFLAFPLDVGVDERIVVGKKGGAGGSAQTDA